MSNPYDYVSPGLARVNADPHFPDMIEGDPKQVNWRWMRKDDPHRWLCDKTMPSCGFINRDEAHILYNTALQFAGKPALEIGCLFGWSTWHMAEAGVNLTVVDPLLRERSIVDRVFRSVGSPSPAYVAQSSPGIFDYAMFRLPWSFIFIDANHDAPHPLIDAVAAAHHAADDALILFHDVICPDVWEAVRFLRWKGWKTRLYYTSQMMAACFRGDVRPIHHMPDPAIVELPLPDHLLHRWDDDDA